MNILYDALADRAFLKDAAQKRAAEIEQLLGDAATDVSWDLRTGAAPRELVLVARSTNRQAEEEISGAELIGGNGLFTDKLKRMKDALAHNGVWRVGVHNLMRDAREWCRELPNTTVEDYTVTLNEERSGRYELPALRVSGNGSIMWVEPVAGWVVNPVWVERSTPTGTNTAVGRADLKGPGGPIYLYCLDNGTWVYQTRALSPQNDLMFFSPLNRDAFLQLSRACLDV